MTAKPPTPADRGVHEEELVRQGTALERQLQDQNVSGQLGQVLAHLRRYRDSRATLALVDRLQQSRFARRTKSSPEQYEALFRHLRPILSKHDWQDAAVILGWAQRLTRK